MTLEQLQAEYGRIVLQIEWLQAEAQRVKLALKAEMEKPKAEPVKE